MGCCHGIPKERADPTTQKKQKPLQIHPNQQAIKKQGTENLSKPEQTTHNHSAIKQKDQNCNKLDHNEHGVKEKVQMGFVRQNKGSQLDKKEGAKIIKNLKQVIDMKCEGAHYFEFRETDMRYMGEDGEFTQLLGSISVSQLKALTIRIKKSKKRQIGIGVISSNRRGERWTSYTHPHVIYYNGRNGAIEGDGEGWIKQEGEGFKEGDEIRVRCELEKGKIEWVVNGKQSAFYEMSSFKEKDINWVPYLVMYSKGDEVEWIF